MITKREFQKEKIMSGDPEELIRLVWAIHPKGLYDKFKENGVIINDENDLDTLIRLAKSGDDKTGQIKNTDGKPLVFDTMKILDQVYMPYNTLKQSGIKIY